MELKVHNFAKVNYSQSSLIGHMKSLKTLSYDDIHKCYLTDSVVTAIDFDKIPREYCKAITKTQMPCSNDAL